MKKLIFLFLGCLMTFSKIEATYVPGSDEGMWLPILLKTLNYDDMAKLGCRLTPDQIWSVNNSCLKDAVVQMGGFCTAEIVSDQGLMFTNHHCGYDAVAGLSTPEHDYLTNGFWAKSKDEELNYPGLTVSFLLRMEDVTARMLAVLKDKPEADRGALIGDESKKIVEEAATEANGYNADVVPMFNGNQYFLMVYETYRDIRLVGVPNASIGKYGGDTDNWMWPRHTGDFSIFRVYAGADNKPADYSASNKPLKPKHFLPVSIKGLHENDFSMIMGYPGSTDRYQPSSGIEQAYKYDNPDYVKLFDARLKTMKVDMDKSDEVRLILASDYASIANTWKYFLGQNEGLAHAGLMDKKIALENEFNKWANQNPDRAKKYGGVLASIKANFEGSREAKKLSLYCNVAGFSSSMITYGFQYWQMYKAMTREGATVDSWKPMAEPIKAMTDANFEAFAKIRNTDQRLFAALNRIFFADIPTKSHPDVFTSKEFLKLKPTEGKDRFDLYAEYLYKNSLFANKEKANAFLAKPSQKALEADPGFKYLKGMITVYREQARTTMALFNEKNDDLMRVWESGLMEMNPNKKYYPDANFTMRLTYGKVTPYDPRDAVKYTWYTTTDGILEKEKPGDEEFDVPPRLHDLLVAKDFGRYGKNGELVVCFLSNNDITGGNSGSPVINGNGELIGLAFDGNWEAMTGDLMFDNSKQRTISVDIRYVLFIIDKYAGAKNIIDELKVME